MDTSSTINEIEKYSNLLRFKMSESQIKAHSDALKHIPPDLLKRALKEAYKQNRTGYAQSPQEIETIARDLATHDWQRTKQAELDDERSSFHLVEKAKSEPDAQDAAALAKEMFRFIRARTKRDFIRDKKEYLAMQERLEEMVR